MKTILIVGDGQEALDAVGECLNRPGIRLAAITEGRLALSAMRGGERVDMVIADCRMRDMDGLEFLARLKEITQSVPVVIFSGRASIECYLKSLSLGAFEYLTKPFEAKDLERIVKAVFGDAESGRKRLRHLGA